MAGSDARRRKAQARYSKHPTYKKRHGILASLIDGVEFEWKDMVPVDALAEKLDARLKEWGPETAAEARQRIAEVIDLADADLLDLARSRTSEQEVLDLLDEPRTQ